MFFNKQNNCDDSCACNDCKKKRACIFYEIKTSNELDDSTKEKICRDLNIGDALIWFFKENNLDMIGNLIADVMDNYSKISEQQNKLEYLKKLGYEELINYFLAKEEEKSKKNCIWYITNQTRKYIAFDEKNGGDNKSVNTYYKQFLKMLNVLNISEEYFIKTCKDNKKRIFFNAMQYPSYVPFKHRKLDNKYNAGEELFILYKEMMKKWNVFQKNLANRKDLDFSNIMMIRDTLTMLLSPFDLNNIEIYIEDKNDLQFKDENVYKDEVNEIEEAVMKYFFNIRRGEEENEEEKNEEDLHHFLKESFIFNDIKWNVIRDTLSKLKNNSEAKVCVMDGVLEIEQGIYIYLDYILNSFLSTAKGKYEEIKKQDSENRYLTYANIWKKERLLCAKNYYELKLHLNEKIFERSPQGMNMLQLMGYDKYKKQLYK